MTTDEHFQAALGDTAKAAQNAAQQVRVLGGMESQTEVTAHEKTPVLPGFAAYCGSTRQAKVAGTGFEPATSRL